MVEQIKGSALLILLEKRKSVLSWWKFFSNKKLVDRIQKLKELGLKNYYWKIGEDTWQRCEDFDPDLSVRNRKKTKEIQNGNECVSKCLNCSYGAIFEIDPIEKIGQCHMCFTEFKLS